MVSTPKFAPAGQSTQVVIGASPESDLDILSLSESLYKEQNLKRVYYSGYVPISMDARLPALTAPPVEREHRLYQADWLLRFYGFTREEIVDAANPNLDTEVDPKLAYALRHPDQFPVDVNTAPREVLLRIPGVGVKGVNRILRARRFGSLRREHLQKDRDRVEARQVLRADRRPGFSPVELGTDQPAAVNLARGEAEGGEPVAVVLTLIYDNTYAGLLTAVFECFRLKAGPETIIRAEADCAEELFATPVVVTTDPAAAKRVRVGLDKRDKEAAQLCCRCFLSEDAHREELILHLVRRTVAAGAGVADDITDDRMLRLKRLNQQMGREILRMHAFVRFQEKPDGLYTALVEPDFNVLPLLQPHFVARYPGQDWLIYDTRRHYGLHLDQSEAAITLSSDRYSHEHRSAGEPGDGLPDAVANLLSGHRYIRAAQPEAAFATRAQTVLEVSGGEARRRGLSNWL